MTLIEFLIIICVILILLSSFAVYVKMALKIVRETALINELSNMRMSIEHYRMINGELPQELVNLMNAETFRVDREGYLLDPFMNRYYYDNQEGKARSQTKGYESW